MSNRFKTIFMGACVVVPFLIYCVYYYSGVIRRAPFKFTEFDSFTIQYGFGDSLINKYDSKTGNYQYVDDHDSLIKKSLRLTNNELLYLHRKAASLGFWDFPSVEMGDTTQKINGHKPLRYVIEFKYKRKSKKVVFDKSFYGDPKLIDANEQMVKEITKTLDDEEGKQKN